MNTYISNGLLHLYVWLSAPCFNGLCDDPLHFGYKRFTEVSRCIGRSSEASEVFVNGAVAFGDALLAKHTIHGVRVPQLEQLVVIPKYKAVELHVHGDNHMLSHQAGLEETDIPAKRDEDLANCLLLSIPT